MHRPQMRVTGRSCSSTHPVEVDALVGRFIGAGAPPAPFGPIGWPAFALTLGIAALGVVIAKRSRILSGTLMLPMIGFDLIQLRIADAT